VALKDLANKIGEPPNVIEKPAYRLAPEYGLENRRREPKERALAQPPACTLRVSIYV